MKIPVVLSTVHVGVSEDGQLAIDVDGKPYDVGWTLARADLGAVLDRITTAVGTAVRVEIREADGTTYADIATPPSGPDTTSADDQTLSTPPSGITGHGFSPGEPVALAYVLFTETADADGLAAVNLPPALLSKRGSRLVLIGMTSAAMAEIEQQP
ncbi:hypothetical protein [Nocardioides campestrisoli]|uniref:hypothetical protein n=1 Tax=Nocardioides campestrisoli TaxID=2736757 RepID=UPI00163D7BDB|nr:hypothetical protein [Nocardioides campestrisoli]